MHGKLINKLQIKWNYEPVIMLGFLTSYSQIYFGYVFDMYVDTLGILGYTSNISDKGMSR